MSKISANLHNKLCDLHTYINDEVLTYVIILAVVSRVTFGFIKLNVVSIVLENKEFLYTDTEESILCVDQIRQYCLMVDEDRMCVRKVIL